MLSYFIMFLFVLLIAIAVFSVAKMVQIHFYSEWMQRQIHARRVKFEHITPGYDTS